MRKHAFTVSAIANNLGAALSELINGSRSDIREVGSSESSRSITLNKYCVHTGRCSSSACVRMRWVWWDHCEEGEGS